MSAQSYRRIVLGVILFTFLLTLRGYAFIWRGVEITPHASLRQGYDDNITYLKDHPIDNFITHLLLGLSVNQESKIHSLSLDVSVARQIFADNGSFDNTIEEMTMRLKQELSKYDSLTINNSFSHAEDPRSFEDAFGRTSGRYSTYHNSFHLDHHHDLNDKFAWNFRYGNDFSYYSRKDLSDSSMNTAGTSVDYAINPITILSTNYDYIQRDFSPGPSASVNESSVNVRRFLATHLYVDLQSGADFFDSYNGQKHTQPFYRTSLTDDINPTTQTGISYEKRYSTTSYAQELFNIWRVSVKLAKQLTSRLQTFFTAFYGSGKYVTSEIKDKLTGVNVGCSYELTKNTSANLNYVFAKDDSTQTTNSYTKNAVYFGITIEF